MKQHSSITKKKKEAGAMPCVAFGVVQEMTIFISTFLFFFFYVV
jgi:hypothetical protein